jgi:hypothetical protein
MRPKRNGASRAGRDWLSWVVPLAQTAGWVQIAVAQAHHHLPGETTWNERQRAALVGRPAATIQHDAMSEQLFLRFSCRLQTQVGTREGRGQGATVGLGMRPEQCGKAQRVRAPQRTVMRRRYIGRSNVKRSTGAACGVAPAGSSGVGNGKGSSSSSGSNRGISITSADNGGFSGPAQAYG